MNKGILVTIEGVDGSGKTRLWYNLTSLLEGSKTPYVATKEPGDGNYGSNLGLQLRKLLFEHPSTNNMTLGVRDLLFLADHIQNVGTIIEPSLAEGKVVLCDRYSDSQFAYENGDQTIPKSISEVYHNNPGPEPDLTVLLTCDIKVALERANNREFEVGKQTGKKWSSLEKLAFIQSQYIYNLAHLPRTLIVDTTTASQLEVSQRVWDRIQKVLTDDKEEYIADPVLSPS